MDLDLFLFGRYEGQHRRQYVLVFAADSNSKVYQLPGHDLPLYEPRFYFSECDVIDLNFINSIETDENSF